MTISESNAAEMKSDGFLDRENGGGSGGGCQLHMTRQGHPLKATPWGVQDVRQERPEIAKKQLWAVCTTSSGIIITEN